MAVGIFITGTDTGVGKTQVSLGLMAALQAQGLVVSGMKPVASGAEMQAGGVLVHDDALALQQQGSTQLDYSLINPYVFSDATAPHIAAKSAAISISLEYIQSAYRKIEAVSERVIVEGVGGWRVPLADDVFLADLVTALSLPVILVVHLRIGCLNHALLTAERVCADGLKLIGWVANHAEKTLCNDAEYIVALEQRMPAPKIAEIPYMQRPHIATLSALLHPYCRDSLGIIA